MDKKKYTAIRPKSDARGKESDFSLRDCSLGVLTGLGVMLAAALVLILIGSIISYSGSNPSSAEKYAALIALYASVFIGGIITAKAYRNQTLVGGIFYSALCLALIFVLKLIVAGGSGRSIEGSTVLAVCIVPCALAGTLVGSRRHKGVKSRKPKNFRKK